MIRLSALALVLLSGAALAHGDAAWIQQKHPSCCGIKDCNRVYPMAVRWEESTVIVTLESDGTPYEVSIPKASVRVSIDLDFWLCAPAALIAQARGSCLFVPTTAGAQ